MGTPRLGRWSLHYLWRRAGRLPGEEPVTLQPADVTACLVTRGDVDLEPILNTFPDYAQVVIWGPDQPEFHVFGRYIAIDGAWTDVVYTQDDDCIFRHHEELLERYEPWRVVANYGHGENPDGYDDMALVHGGALMDAAMPMQAFKHYLDRWPLDEGFFREADMINGTISPHTHTDLPFEIRMDIATRPNRMCNQPWQKSLKLEITDRARKVRDDAVR